ncbi:hypothetical protein COCVIDRAFT_41554 [Bipolaris victoriae FI3]|uniref:Uncharacterized protein n=1 Tax=Bipolaris victoriae (strain FI3) TaxID=930091 RepID=W7E9P1_BIPV3|nr:hypothetical protein COCVIDRAFT_41554 [Bipolaris victoriae FI3]
MSTYLVPACTIPTPTPTPTHYVCTLLTLLPRHQRLRTPHNAHLSLSSSASASPSKLLRPRFADPPCCRANHRCPHPFFFHSISLPTHALSPHYPLPTTHNHAPKEKSLVFTPAPHVNGVGRRSWVCACVMCVHVRVKGKKDLTGFFRTTVTGTCA